jgi:hypothetical protein
MLWSGGFLMSTPITQADSIAYAYTRSITINKSSVVGTNLHFPVLLSGAYLDLRTVANGGSVRNAKGYDIIFTSDSAGVNVLPLYLKTTTLRNFWCNAVGRKYAAYQP